jgi:L-ectoine synthase
MENEYRNHFEACVCIAGRGRLHDLKSGEVHDLYPGVLYALNRGERHILEAIEELTLISIFSPPLVGPEVHDENGSYPDLTRG